MCSIIYKHRSIYKRWTGKLLRKQLMNSLFSVFASVSIICRIVNAPCKLHRYTAQVCSPNGDSWTKGSEYSTSLELPALDSSHIFRSIFKILLYAYSSISRTAPPYLFTLEDEETSYYMLSRITSSVSVQLVYPANSGSEVFRYTDIKVPLCLWHLGCVGQRHLVRSHPARLYVWQLFLKAVNWLK